MTAPDPGDGGRGRNADADADAPGPAEALLLLDAREQELRTRAEQAGAELDEVRHARTATTADDEHDPEGSTLSQDWSRAVGLREAALAGLREVEEARRRVDTGTWGRCVRCGGPVGAGRLRARPTAALCVTCAARSARDPLRG
ncbi:TraR/DksA family transcriptional regulator [Cellulomonas marina]|uniref:RNA polymerase-binding transcription factor DksA n=1 Tax=Cellulomonas marina TaxID=988821 RepID=A0A1I0XHD4_9CELL|nr:TraR/DksA family transcriptional regulator [Cellulomonas marina]GIG29879.1 DnaK suppressor protein [Cellulomonas marina]SFA99363.1 RNA polymerase-binding transcription factor DksA [Cellulomonas marina]